MAALNSNEGIVVSDAFQIQLGIAQFVSGSGYRRQIVDLKKDCKAKRSIVTIKNRDNLCLARALAVSVMVALNSNEGIVVSVAFQIQLGIAQFVSGSGYRRQIVDLKKDCKAKRSIVTIKNRDYLCL